MKVKTSKNKEGLLRSEDPGQARIAGNVDGWDFRLEAIVNSKKRTARWAVQLVFL